MMKYLQSGRVNKCRCYVRRQSYCLVQLEDWNEGKFLYYVMGKRVPNMVPRGRLVEEYNLGICSVLLRGVYGSRISLWVLFLGESYR